jgi:hypothetical protein
MPMILPGMTPFLNACGATGPLQLAVASRDGAEVLGQVWHQPFAVLGRDPRSDLVLDNAEVSQRHAYLQILDGHVFAVDLGSRTGLHWPDGLARSGWLAPSGGLGLGTFRVTLAAGARPGTPDDGFSPLVSRRGGLDGLPAVELEFVNTGGNPGPWGMHCRLALIGRAPQCRVRLQGYSVSRCHCSLLRTRAGLWAIDLLGREGVRVNGQGVRFARLADGDRLQIGQFTMRVHCESLAPDGAANEMAGAAAPVYLPAPVITTGMDGSVVGPLLDQFAAMQQSLFDQFQESMVMMVRMFGNAHREQMGEIRTELEELRDLTRELKDLQRQMAETPAPPTPWAPEPDAEPVGVAASQPIPEAQVEELLATLDQEVGAAAAAESVAKGSGPPHREHSSEAPPNGDIHAWLIHRMASIETERQSRWQKIMGVLKGKRA